MSTFFSTICVHLLFQSQNLPWHHGSSPPMAPQLRTFLHAYMPLFIYESYIQLYTNMCIYMHSVYIIYLNHRMLCQIKVQYPILSKTNRRTHPRKYIYMFRHAPNLPRKCIQKNFQQIYVTYWQNIFIPDMSCSLTSMTVGAAIRLYFHNLLLPPLKSSSYLTHPILLTHFFYNSFLTHVTAFPLLFLFLPVYFLHPLRKEIKRKIVTKMWALHQFLPCPINHSTTPG